jgi:hypothetical protein
MGASSNVNAISWAASIRAEIKHASKTWQFLFIQVKSVLWGQIFLNRESTPINANFLFAEIRAH